MNLLAAIENVLNDSNKPLHVSEVCQLVVSNKLWNTEGKTPEDTVGARIYSEIKIIGKAFGVCKSCTKNVFP